MLRPATPLTVLLLISFVLLLLSVISTPVVKSIPIATYQGVNFGVFGYCGPSSCSGIRVGYTTDGLFGAAGDGDFNLPSSARHSLSSLLIVHPVAAFCNLVCLALAAAAHLHSPSHSARYLLALLILLLPTLLVTLLAFLVDILLFVPHLQWGGWIVLASTILITASGVVTCAMRRTLVSRKARKKRIAENAEMSGENFYNRQAQEAKMAPQTFAAEPTMPMVNGAPGADRLPTFATFDPSKKPDDDRQPLRAQALSNDPTTIASSAASQRSNSRPPYDRPRDRYGNPVSPGAGPGPGPGMGPLPGRRDGSLPPPGPYRDGSLPPPGIYRDTSLPPPGAPGYGPRGRGNYPPPRAGYPPRGGYGPRGPPPPQGYPGRGGFSAEMRGGYGGRGRGSYVPAAGAVAGGMAAGAMMAGGQGGRPPPDYPPGGQPPVDDYPSQSGPSMPIAASRPFIEDDQRGYDPTSPSVYTQGPDEAPGPYGSRVQSPSRDRMSPFGPRGPPPPGLARQASPPPPLPIPQASELAGTATRDFHHARSLSQGPYVPPRAHWNTRSNDDFRGPQSPDRYATSPVELPSAASHVGAYGGPPPRQRVNSGGSDVYYEDVEPQFAPEPENARPVEPDHPHVEPVRQVPALLTPGPPAHYGPDASGGGIPQTNSYEDLPGARSPAESETSNFTSVSQRGVNPNWRPANGGDLNPMGPARRRDQQMKRDVLLTGNPDFEIPGMAASGRTANRNRGGLVRPGGMGGDPARFSPASAAGGSADGRYPMGPPPP